MPLSEGGLRRIQVLLEGRLRELEISDPALPRSISVCGELMDQVLGILLQRK